MNAVAELNMATVEPAVIDAAREDSSPRMPPLYGLWRSPRGVLYVCDGTEFVCVMVTSPHLVGWIGKPAVRVTGMAGGVGEALQAFRNPRSGYLTHWESIRIQLAGDVLTKYFLLPHPARNQRGDQLK
jgi:hypothetical protein